MTEYELADLINGISSNIVAGQAVFLTVLSAYLVVAFSVGKKLTTYQVCFINFAYVVMAFVGFQSQAALLASAYNYSDQLLALRGHGGRFDDT